MISVAVLLAGIYLHGMGLEYIRMKRYFSKINELLEQLDETYLIQEMLDLGVIRSREQIIRSRT